MYTEPIAFFLTWSVYGTHLPGDHRGWFKVLQGPQQGNHRLNEWHQERLKHPVRLLNVKHREIVNRAIIDLCSIRNWKAWIVNARSNHVHAVISASDCSGDEVRDQMKARATKELRVVDNSFRNRPIWTRGGDWRSIFELSDLEACVIYAGEAQDCKAKDLQ